jgi:hypothetical protein
VVLEKMKAFDIEGQEGGITCATLSQAGEGAAGKHVFTAKEGADAIARRAMPLRLRGSPGLAEGNRLGRRRLSIQNPQIPLVGFIPATSAA